MKLMKGHAVSPVEPGGKKELPRWEAAARRKFEIRSFHIGARVS